MNNVELYYMDILFIQNDLWGNLYQTKNTPFEVLRQSKFKRTFI